MFETDKEKDFANRYLEEGYIIEKIDNKESFDFISSFMHSTLEKIMSIRINEKEFDNYLNNFHSLVNIDELNKIRLSIINSINQNEEFKYHYYNIAKKYLDIIVGNELAMQQKINFSIQLPNDSSSLLPLHADVWSGDSPFEIVVWVPLVDCFGTKTMYLLPPSKSNELYQKFSIVGSKSAEDVYESIKNDLIWLKVDKGEILIFNQALPHGNIVNKENETRWSMNCRFKNIFTPYGDKKLGEFFRPITLKPASKVGLNYKFPNLNKK